MNTLYDLLNKYKEKIHNQPKDSDAFYTMANGARIRIHRLNTEETKCTIAIGTGIVETGETIYMDNDNILMGLTIYPKATLKITKQLLLNHGCSIECNGGLIIEKRARLYLRGNKSNVVASNTSTVTIDNSSDVIVNEGSLCEIFGSINIDVSRLKVLKNNPRFILADGIDLQITNIPELKDVYTLNNYLKSIHEESLTPDSIGEKVFNDGKSVIGYSYAYGDYDANYWGCDIQLFKGDIILGNFHSLFYGSVGTTLEKHERGKEYKDCHYFRNLRIDKSATLHIVDKVKDADTYMPGLYIGYSSKENTPIDLHAKCTVFGKVICSGNDSIVILDHGMIVIEEDAEMYFYNHSTFKLRNNGILQINGTLRIDSIDRMVGFNPDAIVFGKNGRLIIENTDHDKDFVWLETPIGFKSHKIHTLITGDTIQHLTVKFNQYTGIKLDRYTKYFGRDVSNWFFGKRFEECIAEGIFEWDHGFIELDYTIFEWLTHESNLKDVGILFNTSASYDVDRLQEFVSSIHAFDNINCIIFKFVSRKQIKRIPLYLKNINIRHFYYNGMNDRYILRTSNDGMLYLTNSEDVDVVKDYKQKEIIYHNECEFNVK
jgi:hypothetical protein|nr:MAG TPA: hypothetical protein [Caudoviricetes sp.]